MTKNFIEVGGTYKSKNGWDWECICVKWDRAWLVLNGDHNMPAHPFHLDGTLASLPGKKEYQLLPPKPEIEKSDANLWYSSINGWVLSHLHVKTDPNGILYTHPEAEVALFVPENINGETLAEAIGALQAEIGG